MPGAAPWGFGAALGGSPFSAAGQFPFPGPPWMQPWAYPGASAAAPPPFPGPWGFAATSGFPGTPVRATAVKASSGTQLGATSSKNGGRREGKGERRGRGSTSSASGRGRGGESAQPPSSEHRNSHSGAVSTAMPSSTTAPDTSVTVDGAAKTRTTPPENTTTVMLRNIPNRYTQSMLLSLLDEHGYDLCYDFVYLPMDFRNGVNLGYAFVNLLEHEAALRFMTTLQGFSKWFFDSAKVCEV